ncbi:hypothetical protein [Jeotgalibaca porci]
MDILGQLVLCLVAFALLVIVGSFILTMTNVIFDVTDEQQQARERAKKK